MRVNIEIIERLLSGEVVPKEVIEDPFMLRLWEAIINQKRSGRGKMDVTVLIRQGLRFLDCQIDPKLSSAILRVDKVNNLPAKQNWESCSLHIFNEDQNSYYLQAKPWQPSWIPGADEVVPAAAAFADEERRSYVKLPADPFILKNTKFTEYNNSGQRDAIRAMVTMGKGATLVISLPTGSGKSLCAWLPAMLNDGLTVVVIPTTSLALDQENALMESMPFPLAYHGGEDAASQEKRREIRERIRANEQPIIFTSPESLSSSLFDVLLEASYRGQLSHFIVDEAHMVYEWGNEFRSAFQKVAGVRRALLRSSEIPFKTILLSATLTPSSLSLLESLFSEPGPFKVLSAIQLRAEPSFWFVRCTEEKKEAHLMEAVYHLPRPVIIYTSRVDDAERRCQQIKAAGYNRVGLLTGNSSVEERKSVVKNWKSGQLDIVVGTSAFGLGIDQAHVRTVLHVCIPESVDRYYQEVGRGGRDGRAAVSLVIYTEQDKEDARKLSRMKVISLEKGWIRWRTLFTSNVNLGEGRYKINLKERPRIGIEEGDYNENWNLKTLLLMVQAGLITLDEEKMAKPVKTGNALQDEQEWEKYIEENSSQQIIEIKDRNHFNEHYWKEKVGEVRNSLLRESKRSLNTMYQILEESDCTGRILRDYYHSKNIPVVEACGGCPTCRRQNKRIRKGILPSPRFSWDHYTYSLKGDLGTEFRTTTRLFIFHQQEDRLNKNWTTNWQSLVKWMAQKGIMAFSAKSPVLDDIRNCLAGQKAVALLFTKEESISLPPVPQMHLYMEATEVIPVGVQKSKETPTVLLLPYESRDPYAPSRLLRDMIDAPERMINFKDFMTNYKIV